jgi:CubicO group peptidase (beta-lactamase class C family)
LYFAAVTRGKVIHVSMAGLQDIESKLPMADGTIFRIASMSKPASVTGEK